MTEIPYFEGDFWPNILEECIKELEQEEVEKRLREEEEAAADTEDLEPTDRDSTEVGGRLEDMMLDKLAKLSCLMIK